MKKQHVLNCSFSSWYQKFRAVTVKSCILPLPQEFLDYLRSDGVVLPESCLQPQMYTNPTCSSDEDDESSKVNWDDEDPNVDVAEAPSFPAFENELKQIIKKMGGVVFPKLNWSAPRDAHWISFDRTLKCTCPSDVYLLLKSSNFISHDLNTPFEYCEGDNDGVESVKYELILRKWQDFHPGMEFRCFVKNKSLIAICQRNHTQYYQFIPKHKDEIMSDIQAFFYHMIDGKFIDENYVFDVYRRDKGKLLLLDINPFGPVTDGLLFNWEELSSGEITMSDNRTANNHKKPEFRCVDSNAGIQPSPYAVYGLPQDMVDLSRGEDASKLLDLLQMKIQGRDDTDESSSDDLYEPSEEDEAISSHPMDNKDNGSEPT